MAHHVELQVSLAGHMPHLLELPTLDQVGKLGLQAMIDEGCMDLEADRQDGRASAVKPVLLMTHPASVQAALCHAGTAAASLV